MPPQQSLSSSTGAQAHPRAISPVFERADAPLSQNTEIRILSGRRNAEKNKKHAKKFFKKLTPFPKAPKKGETKEGEKGFKQREKGENSKAQLKTKIIQSNQL